MTTARTIKPEMPNGLKIFYKTLFSIVIEPAFCTPIYFLSVLYVLSYLYYYIFTFKRKFYKLNNGGGRGELGPYWSDH